MSEYGGVIDELLARRWRDPETGKVHGIPIDDIEIAESFAGREAELVRALHGGKRIMVVHDAFTRAALGERVFDALSHDGPVEEFVWGRPRCTPEGVAELQAATEGAEALIAVGSGTISDSCKYATHLDGREYSAFATSPMNAYTTPTASVSFGGFKQSITCHFPKGVFFELEVIARCPPRLISAAFADVICRTTAQVDWLMSHLLLGTPYSETAYTLLSYDEDIMVANAAALLRGEPHALATLTRVSAIMGLGTSFTGTTHVGSMAEHMISHAIDMFSGAAHPGTSHGEQVGVASLTMSRLQNAILSADEPPILAPTRIPRARLERDYGPEASVMMSEQTARKAFDEASAAAMNERLARDWDTVRARLAAVLRPSAEVHDALAAAGCQLSGADLGLPPDLYRRLVRDARYIRDRFTMLDLADDSGRLEPFIETLS